MCRCDDDSSDKPNRAKDDKHSRAVVWIGGGGSWVGSVGGSAFELLELIGAGFSPQIA